MTIVVAYDEYTEYYFDTVTEIVNKKNLIVFY
jgi:hypothetical protein